MIRKNTSIMPSVAKAVGGFTLVELMVVVLLVGVLAAYAVPAYTNMVERKRLDSITTSFTGVLQRGQSEAVRRNRPVVVDSIASGADEWVGWVVIVDPDGAADEVIRREAVLPANIEIAADGGATSVEIRADGEVERTYQFAIQDTTSNQCWRLVLYPTGSVRVIERTSATCLVFT